MLRSWQISPVIHVTLPLARRSQWMESLWCNYFLSLVAWRGEGFIGYWPLLRQYTWYSPMNWRPFGTESSTSAPLAGDSIYSQNDIKRSTYTQPVARLNIDMSSYQYRDPHVKDRRSRDRLIFNIGILIPGKTVLILRRGPGREWLLLDRECCISCVNTSKFCKK